MPKVTAEPTYRHNLQIAVDLTDRMNAHLDKTGETKREFIERAIRHELERLEEEEQRHDTN